MGFIWSGRVRYFEALKPLLVPIDSVHPAPYNYNNGDVEFIEESILAEGMYRPIQTQEATDDIVIGNHTWMACKALDADLIPVVPLPVSTETATRLMIADNEIARRAMPDKGLLLDLLARVNNPHVGTGLTERDIEVMTLMEMIPLETNEFAQWPSFTAQMPPHVMKAFMHYTRECDTDACRIELLLRLAGWDGS